MRRAWRALEVAIFLDGVNSNKDMPDNPCRLLVKTDVHNPFHPAALLLTRFKSGSGNLSATLFSYSPMRPRFDGREVITAVE